MKNEYRVLTDEQREDLAEEINNNYLNGKITEEECSKKLSDLGYEYIEL